MSYTAMAAGLANDFADELAWFKADTRSFRIESQFDFIGDLNLKERHQAHWKALNDQIDKLGGVDRALFSALPADLSLDLKTEPADVPVVKRLNAADLTDHLAKLLVSTNYFVFVGLDDKKYSFTDEERALIRQRAEQYFKELE